MMRRTRSFLILLALIFYSTSSHAINCWTLWELARGFFGGGGPSTEVYLQKLLAAGVADTDAKSFLTVLEKTIPAALAHAPLGGGLMLAEMRADAVNNYIKLKGEGFAPAECDAAAFRNVATYIRVRKEFGGTHKEALEAGNLSTAAVGLYGQLREIDVPHSEAYEAGNGLSTAGLAGYKGLRDIQVPHKEAYEAARNLSTAGLGSYTELRAEKIPHTESYEACRGLSASGLAGYRELRKRNAPHKDAYEACRGLSLTGVANYQQLLDADISHKDAFHVAKHFVGNSIRRYIQYVTEEGLDHKAAVRKLQGG
jgi:hypothetical protein